MKAICMVTGSAGFIGSALARRLLEDGREVVGVDAFTESYDPSEKRARAEALARYPRYRHVTGDLVELPLADHLDRVEAIFHLAGRPGVRESFSRTSKYVHDNVEATAHVLQAAQAASSVRRVVYASSSSVYGDAELPLREDGATAPISPYGQTKLDAERLCHLASGPELETVALRYFTVYGPGQRPDMAFRRFAEAALCGAPIHLYGDGSQSRDFTFVDDIVDATYRALDATAGGLAINVGGGARITLAEVLDLLAQIARRPLNVIQEGFAKGDVRHTVADLTRAESLLGFRARVGVREGLTAEVDWLRSMGFEQRKLA